MIGFLLTRQERIRERNTILKALAEEHTPEQAEWLTDEVEHWHTCACGELIDVKPHQRRFRGQTCSLDRIRPTEIITITVITAMMEIMAIMERLVAIIPVRTAARMEEQIPEQASESKPEWQFITVRK